ncbi:hypothetical protein ACJX0J_033038, partial [Zea mays]
DTNLWDALLLAGRHIILPLQDMSFAHFSAPLTPILKNTNNITAIGLWFAFRLATANLSLRATSKVLVN